MQRVELGDDAAGDADSPEAISLALERLRPRPLLHARGVRESGEIAGQIARIAELAADGGVLQDRIHGLGVSGSRGSLEVLDVLAGAEDLAGEATLLLEGIPRSDLRLGTIGAEEIPRVEAGEILHGSHELVAADGGRDELEVVRHRGVVDDGIGNHVCGVPRAMRRGG